MEYLSIDDAIAADGLRVILVRGMPSPWGQAAKAMIEYKGLDYVVGPQEPGGPNPELVDWSGTNSGPVVAWNDEPPLNRWNDILFLIERLAPAKPLLPSDYDARITAMGIAHEICGELGLGWNYRLTMARPAKGHAPTEFALKYGHNDADSAAAEDRVVGLLNNLNARVRAQKAAGSRYLLGDSVTAVDFYWAAFSNLLALMSPERCPLHPKVRPRFERVPESVQAAISDDLLEQRDYIMDTYFRIPMEL